MQKISSIIPSSPRVASVDMKEALPVRPGTPGFGRPEGVSTLKPLPTAELATRSSGADSPSKPNWKARESQQAAAAKEVADRFFIDRIANKPSESEDSRGSADALPVVLTDESDEAILLTAEEVTPLDGPYPKGSFLDYRV